jgi:hypothetical protein
VEYSSAREAMPLELGKLASFAFEYLEERH